ncbi:MAG TPA: type IV pilus twitching motility protein PilT [Polyangia bacterium]|nr:type IV pilus twitching motility protein PilT [Polyangia bacterium]
MARLDELFRLMKEQGCSDLHLSTNSRPFVRRHGAVEPVVKWQPLAEAELIALLREIVSAKQWAEFERARDLDFAHGVEGVARFRCNYFRDESGPGAVMRIIPEKIIPLNDLGLPPAVAKVADFQSGLVVVTGPTGSGKSTTLASIIDAINQTYERHIVTIEDPVEFVHKPKRSVISHREVGSDTESFAAALRAAIRQDADVILVGEMRDLETISLALTAAEMGVLVFGTLHTNSAGKTVDRIIDVFPPEQQPQVRTALAESLKAVIAQLLCRTADGKGRVAANEILFGSSGLSNIIREGNTSQINGYISSGRGAGMRLMDDALFDLASAGKIDPQDAFMKAKEKPRFERFVQGKA